MSDVIKGIPAALSQTTETTHFGRVAGVLLRINGFRWRPSPRVAGRCRGLSGRRMGSIYAHTSGARFLAPEVTRADAIVRRILPTALMIASVPIGVGVGFWTAQLMTDPNKCPPKALCLDMLYVARPIFATWQCILFGAGATAVLLLLSLATTRLRSRARPRRPEGIYPSPRTVSG